MIPAALRSRQQWVYWREERRGNDDRTTKVPYQPSNPGRLASTTDPSTWSSYSEAKAAAKNGDGVGFVFTDDDPFCGIDFDDVVEDGEILSSVWSVLQELNTYCEFSPSRTGVHAIGLAALSDRGKKTDTSPFGGGLEVYDRGRFFCVTGWHVPETPVTIARFDPAPLLAAVSKNGNGNTKQALGHDIRSRHDYVYHRAAEMHRTGVPLEVTLEFARAIARDIELPKREQDEVGRMIKHLYAPISFENRINRAVEQMEVTHRAKQRFEQKFSLGEASLEDVLNGHELLEIPDPEELYVIDPIWPSSANVLIVAEKKTGKTTMMLNLIRALVDGEPFLGSMPVTSRGHKRILFMNYEMVIDTIKNWIKKQGIKNIDGLLFWQLKGQRVRLWEESIAQAMAQFCQEQDVWCIVIDTQILSMRGLVSDENAAMEVADYQQALDFLKVISGVESVVLLHHMNREKKGARGSSRIEDWPDAIWYLRKEADGTRTLELDMIRYYDSRDALPEKLVLGFDRDHDRLIWDGASAVSTKEVAEDIEVLKAIIRSHAFKDRWPTRNELRNKGLISGDSGHKTQVVERLERQGLIVEFEMPRAAGQQGRSPKGMRVTDEGRRVAGV